MFETLEHRRLMRGGVVRADGDTLYVSGTAGDDVIAVSGRRNHIVVTLNGRAVPFSQRLRHAIIYAGGGNDTVTTGNVVHNRTDPPRLGLTAFVDGGAGRDTLESRDSDDTLLGSTGDDALSGDNYYAVGGRDYLDGGPGDDTLKFGRTMHGGSGNDAATVTYSNETITGGLENYTYDDLESTTNPLPIDKPNLFSRDGKLVFSFTTDGDEQESVGTFGTLADGRFDIRVHRIDTTATPRPQVAVRTATCSFNRNEAMRHGIVLRFTVPGSSRIDSALDQTVLVATR